VTKSSPEGKVASSRGAGVVRKAQDRGGADPESEALSRGSGQHQGVPAAIKDASKSHVDPISASRTVIQSNYPLYSFAHLLKDIASILEKTGAPKARRMAI